MEEGIGKEVRYSLVILLARIGWIRTRKEHTVIGYRNAARVAGGRERLM